MKEKAEIYKDSKGEYRWQVKAENGKTIAASTEGYKNKKDCIENAQRSGFDIFEKGL